MEEGKLVLSNMYVYETSMQCRHFVCNNSFSDCQFVGNLRRQQELTCRDLVETISNNSCYYLVARAVNVYTYDHMISNLIGHSFLYSYLIQMFYGLSTATVMRRYAMKFSIECLTSNAVPTNTRVQCILQCTQRQCNKRVLTHIHTYQGRSNIFQIGQAIHITCLW